MVELDSTTTDTAFDDLCAEAEDIGLLLLKRPGSGGSADQYEVYERGADGKVKRGADRKPVKLLVPGGVEPFVSTDLTVAADFIKSLDAAPPETAEPSDDKDDLDALAEAQGLTLQRCGERDGAPTFSVFKGRKRIEVALTAAEVRELLATETRSNTQTQTAVPGQTDGAVPPGGLTESARQEEDAHPAAVEQPERDKLKITGGGVRVTKSTAEIITKPLRVTKSKPQTSEPVSTGQPSDNPAPPEPPVNGEVLPATVLDDEQARSLDTRLRTQARVFDDSWEQLRLLIEEARTGQIHPRLGFKSWPDYIADVVKKEMPNVARSVDQRRQVVELLAGEGGMSDRATAAAIGVSNATISRDQDAIEEAKQVLHDVTPETVELDSPPESDGRRRTGLDGKSYPEPKPKPVMNSMDDPAPEAKYAQLTGTTPDEDEDGVLAMRNFQLIVASNMDGLDARVHVTFLGAGHVDPDPVDIAVGKSRLPARIEPIVAEELAIDLRLALSGIEALIVQLDRRAKKGMAYR